jgi:hypothetical protein
MNANVLDFFGELDSSRIHMVKFEDLVAEPKTKMMEISEFLGLEFNETLINPYDQGRMTDGLHSGSRSIGDPNFLNHQKIDPSLGEVWKEINLHRRLSGFAKRIAKELEYDLPWESNRTTREPESSGELIQNQKAPGIILLSRDRHRIDKSKQGNIEISDLIKDDLFGKDG